MIKSICVFCASSEDLDELYYEKATEFGRALGRHKLNLIHGGGQIGLMGRLSKAALECSVHVTGIVPEALNKTGIVSEYDSRTIVTRDMMTRKARMRKLADAFVALPGGFGTFEELLEIITLKQLKYHTKPIVILNVNNYFKYLLLQFETAYNEKFANQQYKQLFLVTDDIEEAIQYIINYRHQNVYDKYLKA
ncbi:MAG: TIGR00730 family Rossman fold protein [Bacteroidales bacterium]|nr:TIGR00730 family Rossman fold protein [Bacteroidales bacterium]HQP04512.1 TIGR00730 family Rossman fold protein [Bacteroidales bacterium]